MIALRRHEAEGMMSCQGCTPDRQGRFGCASGTTSDIPFQLGPHKLDRCPLALCRDIPPDDDAWITWGTRWANAQTDGSLAYLLPCPSAYALEIIHLVTEEWRTQQREREEERRRELEAESARLRGVH